MKLTDLIKKLTLVVLALALMLPAAANNVENTVKKSTTAESDSLTTSESTFAPVIMLEDWMFESAYLQQDVPILEDWMMDDNYLGDDLPAVEEWMLDEQYLEPTGSSVEPWMLCSNYLK